MPVPLWESIAAVSSVRSGNASRTAGMIDTMGERLRAAATKGKEFFVHPATLKRSSSTS